MKKITALFLALLIGLMSLSSCGSNDDDSAASVVQLVDADTENSGETAEIDTYIDGLAKKHDFSGESFTWIGGGSQAPTEEEETGDIMSDALYYRQREIEEKFHIEWSNFMPPEQQNMSTHPVVEAVRQDVLAGGGAYDAGYGTAVAVCQPLFINDCLLDTSQFNVLDLSGEWWTQSLIDTYSIGGSVYFLNGAIVTSNYMDAYGILFSKQAVLDYNIGDLYELVHNNEWTFDKMFQVASVVPINTNGSGTYRYSSPNGFAVMFGNGMTITKYDALSRPYVPELLPEEFLDLATKFSYYFGNYSTTARYASSEMIGDGRVLFSFATMQSAAEMRQLEDTEFGILPIPKGDVNQKDYVSYAEPWIAFHVFVPKTTKKLEVTDVVIEAMGALGIKYIKPTYYDNILKSRSVYDTQSKEMIDIIFRTKIYDLLDILAMGGGNNGDSQLVAALKHAIVLSTEGLASKYKMEARTVNRNIERILKSIEKDNS